MFYACLVKIKNKINKIKFHPWLFARWLFARWLFATWLFALVDGQSFRATGFRTCWHPSTSAYIPWDSFRQHFKLSNKIARLGVTTHVRVMYSSWYLARLVISDTNPFQHGALSRLTWLHWLLLVLRWCSRGSTIAIHCYLTSQHVLNNLGFELENWHSPIRAVYALASSSPSQTNFIHLYSQTSGRESTHRSQMTYTCSSGIAASGEWPYKIPNKDYTSLQDSYVSIYSAVLKPSCGLPSVGKRNRFVVKTVQNGGPYEDLQKKIIFNFIYILILLYFICYDILIQYTVSCVMINALVLLC